MVVTLLIALVAIVCAILVGFVARQILGTAVGWPRSIVVGLLVFFLGVPVAGWVLRQTGMPDGATLAADDVWLWIGLIARR